MTKRVFVTGFTIYQPHLRRVNWPWRTVWRNLSAVFTGVGLPLHPVGSEGVYLPWGMQKRRRGEGTLAGGAV